MGKRDDADLDVRLKARRVESVRGPFGPLALVNSQVVDIEQPVWLAPGVWGPLPGGQSGLVVRAVAADGVMVDGDLVDGSAIVAGNHAVVPSAVSFDEHTRATVVRTEHGPYALRVWKDDSEAVQTFDTIDAYAYEPEWVLEGRYLAGVDGETIAVSHLRDAGAAHDTPAAGTVEFTHDGASWTVDVIGAGDMLQLIFSDATSGTATYSVGRFLFVRPGTDGTVVLDFNRAVLPPCAFSYNFNCPIPPERNRLPFPIEAGEKNVLAKDGSVMH